MEGAGTSILYKPISSSTLLLYEETKVPSFFWIVSLISYPKAANCVSEYLRLSKYEIVSSGKYFDWVPIDWV